MKTIKPTIYMIYGQYGSGKTNVLFKLCFKKLTEKDSGNKIILISANYCTLGQNNICEKFCEITKILFESKFQENLTGFNYVSDTTYSIDFGCSLKDQKHIFEFFNSGNFNFNPILTIPAFMDFSIAESVLSQFSFITKSKLLLTFCDYVSKTRISDFEVYLKKLNTCIIGLNNFSNLSRGFILK